jgi:hypothetical protein
MWAIGVSKAEKLLFPRYQKFPAQVLELPVSIMAPRAISEEEPVVRFISDFLCSVL